ncbi:hypothetical protein, partial [Halorubrum kocurii]|uniref:hypothetical protein n=1 Tax=Halorubrum kocurii TaxID=478441 RepID=UPI0019D3FDC7
CNIVVAKVRVGFLSGLLASRFRLSVGTPRYLRPEAPPRKLLKSAPGNPLPETCSQKPATDRPGRRRVERAVTPNTFGRIRTPSQAVVRV